jgi:hypothetical protein
MQMSNFPTCETPMKKEQREIKKGILMIGLKEGMV